MGLDSAAPPPKLFHKFPKEISAKNFGCKKSKLLECYIFFLCENNLITRRKHSFEIQRRSRKIVLLTFSVYFLCLKCLYNIFSFEIQINSFGIENESFKGKISNTNKFFERNKSVSVPGAGAKIFNLPPKIWTVGTFSWKKNAPFFENNSVEKHSGPTFAATFWMFGNNKHPSYGKNPVTKPAEEPYRSWTTLLM